MTAITPTPVTVATIGVKKPTSRQTALTNTIAATNHPSTCNSGEPKYARPSTMSVRATNPRSNKSPRPGEPLGNVQNNLCRLVLLYKSPPTRGVYRFRTAAESSEQGNFQYLFVVMSQEGTKRVSHKKAQKAHIG